MPGDLDNMRAVAAGAAMTWNEAAGRCDNVAAGVVLDVLTAAVGAAAAPQAKASFARAAHVHTAWQFPAHAAGGAAKFTVTAAVRFVRQRQVAQDAARALPPLRPFPADLFYPFTA